MSHPETIWEWKRNSFQTGSVGEDRQCPSVGARLQSNRSGWKGMQWSFRRARIEASNLSGWS